jgi:hypothetical protein
MTCAAAATWLTGPVPARGDEPATQASRPARAERRPSASSADPAKARLLRAAAQFRGIRDGMLNSRLPEVRERGRARILELLNDENVGVFSRELLSGDVFSRAVLVEGLSRLRGNESATLQLATVFLLEPEPAVRGAALSELRRRDSVRTLYMFQEALYAPNDAVVARAAAALAEMGATAAVPDLIKNLTVDRNQHVSTLVPASFTGTSYADVYRWGPGGWAAAYPVGQNSLIGNLVEAWRVAPVTVMRTEVRDALRHLTGQDFGFDVDAWSNWYLAQMHEEAAK